MWLSAQSIHLGGVAFSLLHVIAGIAAGQPFVVTLGAIGMLLSYGLWRRSDSVRLGSIVLLTLYVVIRLLLGAFAWRGAGAAVQVPNIVAILGALYLILALGPVGQGIRQQKRYVAGGVYLEIPAAAALRVFLPVPAVLHDDHLAEDGQRTVRPGSRAVLDHRRRIHGRQLRLPVRGNAVRPMVVQHPEGVHQRNGHFGGNCHPGSIRTGPPSFPRCRDLRGCGVSSPTWYRRHCCFCPWRESSTASACRIARWR